MAKQYVILATHRGQTREVTGDIDDLRDRYQYLLDCGHSWNSKIKKSPKTITALVNAINASVSETQGSCFDPDFYELKRG